MPQVKNNRVLNLQAVYFRKNGEKREMVFSTARQANAFRRRLKQNKRKFLGTREFQAVEVVN